MAASYRFRVEGRVQGVYFRQATRERAEALGLSGWVTNRADGSVEGIAQGEAAALEALCGWLRHGPPAARVERLDWQAEEAQTLRGFEVRR